MADVIKNSTTPIEGHTTGASGSAVATNYISQIAAGSVTYDIATHHSIKFHAGQSDTSGTAWNGITDLDVYIPSITDLVTDPIRIAGTCATDGSVYTVTDGVASVKSTYTKAKGDIVFIGTDCTFEKIACEAGDMAIWDGTQWTVIQGENQVEILNVTNGKSEVALTGTAKEILKVEGKILSLNIDYSDVNSHLNVTKSAAQDLTVSNGKVTVDGQYVAISKVADTTSDISTSVSIELPTALASGAVTISTAVLTKTDLSWNAGTAPSLQKNTATISVDASTSVGITKVTGSDFVSSITGDVLKSATISSSDSSSTGAIKYTNGLTTSNGTSFVSGIHAAKTDDEKNTATADFTIPGAYSLSGQTTFASQFGAASDSGDVVSSITVGSVTVDNSGTSFVSGLTTGSDVVTSVTFGSAVKDTATSWFITGLADSGSDVVTGVTVGAVTLASDASSSFATSVMSNASVSNHVLSFGTTSVMSPVNVSQAATTVTSKGFNHGGVKLSGFSFASKGFAKAGISQANTTVSYKSLQTSTVSLTQADSIKYFFDKTASKEYAVVDNYLTLSTDKATVNTSSYELSNTGITASIPVNSVVTGFATSPVLPTLTIADGTTISGTVGTSLSTTTTSWLGVKDDNKNVITAVGAISLITTEDSTNAVQVGKAGEYGVTNATAALPAGFVTDVEFTTTDSSNA